jgi:hypothetical protein
MLHEFVISNREELINRCRAKVSQRSSQPSPGSELRYGVPLFLNQLVEALRHQEASASPHENSIAGFSPSTPGWVEASRTAALHGSELFRLGYSVDQVVHDYGDICQAITELAYEIKAPVTVDEFHTFDRLLDNSIACAVSAYGRHGPGQDPYHNQPLGSADVSWPKPDGSPAPWWVERYEPIGDED